LKFFLWKTVKTEPERIVNVLVIGCFTLLAVTVDRRPAEDLTVDVTVGSWRGRRVSFSLAGARLWYLLADEEYEFSDHIELTTTGPWVLVDRGA